MRIPVHLQREMARLHFYDTATSDRSIADQVDVSPSTVGKFRKHLTEKGVAWDAIQGLDDDGWRDALNTHDHSIAVRKPAPDFSWVHAEMQRPDATLQQLWLEFREIEPQGIGLTQFTAGYKAWKKYLHVVMRQVHRPGEKVFVDFAGRTVLVRGVNGNPDRHAQIFIGALGYSNFTFVYAVPTQSTPDWVKCHVHCFNYMGGAPEWVVPDNLKAAVWRREGDRVIINPAFRDCLRHYDTAAAPARPRRPRDKANAEVAVQIAQRWILFKIRDREYFSFEELNADLRRHNEELNDHKFKRLDTTRRIRFEEKEKAKLKPLPEADYEMSDWTYDVKVRADYHVEHDGSWYSVPFQLAHTRVHLRFTATVLEIFQSGRRVALHVKNQEPGSITTSPEHRPLNHQRALEGEPRELMEWAKSVGENAYKMIKYHVYDRTDGHGLRAARKLRDIARDHGQVRFEEVCAYALTRNATTLRSVQSIFSSSVDLQPRAAGSPTSRPAHDNVRGGNYFGD